MGGLSKYLPGAWGGGTTYEHGVKEWFYRGYKYTLSSSATSSQEDGGISTGAVTGQNIKIFARLAIFGV